MARPARKKSVLVFIELLRATPMPRTNAKYRARISQSIPVILEKLLPFVNLPIRSGARLRTKRAFTKLGAYMKWRACRKRTLRRQMPVYWALPGAAIFQFDKGDAPLL